VRQRIADVLTKISAKRDGIDIHEHGGLAVVGNQPIVNAASHRL
jgi:hypothetical protein